MLDERSHRDIDSWLLRIEGEQQRDSVCSLALRDALMKAVHIECARATGVGACGPHPPLVAEALEVIATDYAGPLRPRDIAARVGVSAAHLSHELKRVTGQSPSEWIMQARIDAAKSLLLSSDHPVHRVAEHVGYSDVSLLNRHFRRLTGLAPEAWRRANKARIPANEALVAEEGRSLR
jgi:AraC-like DNA-binding protein